MATGQTLLRRLVFDNNASGFSNLVSHAGQLMRQHGLKRVDERLEQLRSLLCLRRRLKKDEHRLRMQIRNGLVCKHFPELDRYLAIVRWCLDPRQIAQMP